MTEFIAVCIVLAYIVAMVFAIFGALSSFADERPIRGLALAVVAFFMVAGLMWVMVQAPSGGAS